jgi:hypothetical protein
MAAVSVWPSANALPPVWLGRSSTRNFFKLLETSSETGDFDLSYSENFQDRRSPSRTQIIGSLAMDDGNKRRLRDSVVIS